MFGAVAVGPAMADIPVSQSVNSQAQGVYSNSQAQALEQQIDNEISLNELSQAQQDLQTLETMANYTPPTDEADILSGLQTALGYSLQEEEWPAVNTLLGAIQTLENSNSTSTTTNSTPATVTPLLEPTITPDGGTFTGSVTVTLSNAPSGITDEGEALYTTDGSNPETSNTRTAYTGAFTVYQSETVQAAYYDQPSGNWSNVVSANFVINSTPTTQPQLTPNGSGNSTLQQPWVQQLLQKNSQAGNDPNWWLWRYLRSRQNNQQNNQSTTQPQRTPNGSGNSTYQQSTTQPTYQDNGSAYQQSIPKDIHRDNPMLKQPWVQQLLQNNSQASNGSNWWLWQYLRSQQNNQ